MTDLDAAGSRLGQTSVEPTPPIAEVLATRTRRRQRQRTGRTATAVLAVAAVIVAVVAVWPTHRSRTSLTTTGPGKTGLATGRWSTLPAGPVDNRSEAAVTWAGTGLFVWGGANPAGQLMAGGAMYDPSTRTWSTVTAGPLGRRSFASAVWLGDRVLVWGGSGPPGPKKPGPDVATYDPTTHRWALLPNPPLGLDNGQITWTGSRLVAFGVSGQTNEVGSYDPTTNRWTSIPPPSGSSGDYGWAETVTVDGTVLATQSVTDNCQCQPTTRVWALDATNRWSAVPAPPVALAEPVDLTASGTRMLALEETGTNQGLAQLYDPATQQWTTVATPNPAAATAGATGGLQGATWTGTVFLSFYAVPGNMDGKPERLIGGALDPETHQWTALPLSPTFRTASGGGTGPWQIWTGHELLVWAPSATSAGLVLSPS